MSKQIYIGVGGIAKKVKKLYIGVDGIAREIKKAYVGINGVARLIYEKIRYCTVSITSSGTQRYSPEIRATASYIKLSNGTTYSGVTSFTIEDSESITIYGKRAYTSWGYYWDLQCTLNGQRVRKSTNRNFQTYTPLYTIDLKQYTDIRIALRCDNANQSAVTQTVYIAITAS